MCTVASADGYLIAGLNTCTFKYYVKLCYLTGNILVLKGDSFVIRQGT